MAKKELSVAASKDAWKSKKADAIKFEAELSKPIPNGEYTLGKFIATEGAIKDSDAITFHYDLGNGLKLYTKHINSTTMDSFDKSHTEGVKLPKHYLIPKNRYQNKLTSEMSELSGKKVRITKDYDGMKVKYKEGGYETKEEAKEAYENGTVDTVYKVEFL